MKHVVTVTAIAVATTSAVAVLSSVQSLHLLAFRSGSIIGSTGPTPNPEPQAAADPTHPTAKSVPLLASFFNPRFVEYYFRRILSKFIEDIDVQRIAAKVASFCVWASLLLSGLGTLGFDTKPILSVLGISGITFALAVKDLLTDSFVGLFVLFSRPFHRDQIVTITANDVGYRGKVISMDMKVCGVALCTYWLSHHPERFARSVSRLCPLLL